MGGSNRKMMYWKFKEAKSVGRCFPEAYNSHSRNTTLKHFDCPFKGSDSQYPLLLYLQEV